MTRFERLLTTGVMVVIVTGMVTGLAVPTQAQQSRPDSLTLQTPEDIRVWSVYNAGKRKFVVNVTWRDAPDSMATFIHQPDTTGWAAGSPPATLSIPVASGIYSGDTDRTVAFRAIDGGTVGIDSMRIRYSVNREEHFIGTINLKPGYTPGDPVPVMFRDQRFGVDVDFGLVLAFPAGVIDRQGTFQVGMEDYEGFHIWRGIEEDGSDMVIIGEISKEEAFIGNQTGGSFADSVYLYDVVPTLRDSITWFSPFGTIDCLGTRIDVALEDDQLYWWDCNAFNGFTYQYTVTTFDRGYAVLSGRQGLTKVDHCEHTQGVPYECPDELVSLTMEVDAASDLQRVYTVPNPFRTGGSRLTADSYHNFPDDKIRFVNVPPNSSIKVYTVSGDLVWETMHTGFKGNVEWDVTNRGSEPLSSGVYVYRVEDSDGGSVYGRIVVIR